MKRRLFTKLWSQVVILGMLVSMLPGLAQEAHAAVPAGWSSQDIGSVGQAGSASYAGGTFTVSGSGSDIWGASDQFHFAYYSLSGNGSIVAKLTGQQNTDQWAKAGVMIRSSLAADSAFMAAIGTPGNGVRAQYRTAAAGNALDAAGPATGAPVWLKVERSGGTVSAYSSTDGVNWGSAIASANIAMGTTVYAGLAVTAHNNTALSQVTFTDVSNTGSGSGGTGTGLKGEYFDNSDLTGLAVTRTDATVNFNWGSGSPDPAIGSETFSARWTGQVEAAYSETYTFYTNTDDGVRLWVNNQLLIDKWVNQAPTEWSGSIALTAGQKVDIKMEYYENTAGANASLSWSSPSQSKQIVPQNRLYPASGTGNPPGNSLGRYMGINIDHAGDSGNLKIYANAFKTVRLGSPNNPTDGSVTLDSNGNPPKDFGVFMWDAGGYMKDTEGTYTITFNGSADVAIGMGSVTMTQPVTYNSSTNTSTGKFTVNSNSTVTLKFTNTKRTASSATNTGITNLKIMRPIAKGSTTSYAPTTTFTDAFKNVIMNDFKAKAIRYMDFTATNGKTAEVNWSDRVTPAMMQSLHGGSGYGWQGRGSAWEYVVQLSNETNTDMWICIPVSASDDYILKLARLIKYGSDGVNPYTSPQANPVHAPLKPELKVYLEYSNELWNFAGAFGQSAWNRDKAVAEVNAGGSPLNYDGETNQYTLGWRRQAKRTVEISETFRSVFGSSDMMTRVRPLLEWQQDNGQNTAGVMLNFIDNWYGNRDGNHVTTPRPVNYYIWGGSGSAYYNPDNSSDSLTLSNIWTSQTFNTANWAAPQLRDASYAAAFGLKRTAYEGGPSMDNLGHSESVKEQAWNDSRMKTLLVDHQKFWEQYGGDILMYFTFGGSDHTGYYQWEYVKDMNNPVSTSPKLQAFGDLNAGTKEAVTIGKAIGTTVAGNAWDVINRGWGTPGTGNLTMNTGGGDIRWSSYTFKSSSAGSHTAAIQYSSTNAAQVVVFIDGVEAGTITTSGTGGSSVTFTTSAQSLGAGLHSVRLYCKTGPVTIQSVKLQ